MKRTIINSVGGSLLHLFFPHTCAGCGTDTIDREQLLCLRCLDKLPVTNFHLHAANPVEKIFWGRLPIVEAFSYLYFTKDSLLQNLMHQFKYRGNREIGYFMGRQMALAMLQSNRFRNIDALIPLPLFASREKKRGYNQATILCDGLAELLHVPVVSNSILRTRATETQTHKSRTERWQNMEGKFELREAHSMAQKKILLVDDVVTTGATLEACGEELLKVPGLQLSIATLAYASD